MSTAQMDTVASSAQKCDIDYTVVAAPIATAIAPKGTAGKAGPTPKTSTDAPKPSVPLQMLERAKKEKGSKNMSIPESHYYLVIFDQYGSFIRKAKSPTAAACWHSETELGAWHIREGSADFHYIGYEFLVDGTIKGKPLSIVDLGPVSAHDTPLMRRRVPKGLEKPGLQALFQA